ncbi:hypothetical protein H0H92_013509 [Tricholoma furcatifolium]|nr:hypothetical protein H0H92_013509 [Tricholoma furcatifolium]
MSSSLIDRISADTATTVSAPNPAYPPIVSAGKITVETLRDFEMLCLRFFRNKNVEEADQVKRILSCFEGETANAWALDHEVEFSAPGFTFTNFLAALRLEFISDDIIYDYGDILHAPQGTRSFPDFEAEVRAANKALMPFTNIYMNDARMREHLKLHFNAALRNEYKHLNGQQKTLDTIVRYDDWSRTVARLDSSIRDRHAMEKTLFNRRANEYYNKRSTNSSSAQNTSNTSSNSAGASTTNMGYRKHALRLTDDEKKLLDANDGCRGCRTLWKGPQHICEYGDKPLPFGVVPTITTGYVEAERAKRSKSLRTAKSPAAAPAASSSKVTTVAAVFEPMSSDDEDMISLGSDTEHFFVDDDIAPAGTGDNQGSDVNL